MGKGRQGEASNLEMKPDAAHEHKRRTLVGHKNFQRCNPKSDKFGMQKFHHIEFWCADATNTARRFSHGLGMPMVGKTDLSTSNSLYASYTLRSADLVFVFTSPYSKKCIKQEEDSAPMGWHDSDKHWAFLMKHGLGVRAVGIQVDDAEEAWQVSTANGARGVLPPETILDPATGTSQVISEVELYGDVVMRFVSGTYKGPAVAGQEHVEPVAGFKDFGLQRLDHAVGNVPDLMEQIAYMEGIAGLHEFAEFTAADVGTVDSGLNSMVMANNNEYILLPVNEPTHGTKRKSQIQTYLEQNEGSGLQHLALKTDDVFATLRAMRSAGVTAGFDFMPKPSDDYYKKLPEKIGPDVLTEQQWHDLEELGLLADKDDQGVLLQIFTKPVGDRPTLFLEIIQRVGCLHEVQIDNLSAVDNVQQTKQVQSAGCGGFGKGNFSELFKSIEEYEKTLDV